MFYLVSCSWHVFLGPHVMMSCATLVCVSCCDWVALVMCLVSHWLFVSCDPYCLVFIALVLPLGVFDLKWQ